MPGVREAVAAQAQPIALALGGRAGAWPDGWRAR